MTVLIDQLLLGGFRSVEITLVSRTPIAEREDALRWRHFDPAYLTIKHVEADFTAPGVIESLDFQGLDSILILASSVAQSAEESDARTIVSYELLVAAFETKFAPGETAPSITTEMAHVTSKLRYPRHGDLVLTRPRILGYLQSHVVLRRELNSVFSSLFTPCEGAGILIREIEGYCPEFGKDVRFAEIEQKAAEHGEVALGLVAAKENSEFEVDLCPSAGKVCSEKESLIVLCRST